MVSLMSLWLPILLSAVFVFFLSSIVHMVLPYHRSDYDKLPDEDAVLLAMRKTGVGRGNFYLPHAVTPEEQRNEEIQKKLAEGPVAFVNVLPPGPVNMGKSLGTWFVFCLVVSLFCAYLASTTLGAGASYLSVFQVVGTAAFMAYGLGEVTNSIWKAQKWSTTFKSLFDGLLFALVTAGTCAWLWP